MMARKPPAPGKRHLEDLRSRAAQDPHLERELQALAHLIDGEHGKRPSTDVAAGDASGRKPPQRRNPGEA